jgi:hypothetical protein
VPKISPPAPAPAAPLTPAQHRLLKYFNSLHGEAQSYVLDILEDMTYCKSAITPRRASRVISGGAS